MWQMTVSRRWGCLYLFALGSALALAGCASTQDEEVQRLRARRLVVDTGLHAMGWTREQAIDFGVEASEIERYVVTPGQACAYMIGQLKIVELRERARAALGERFAIRDFHRVVLNAGVVPLELLEREVDAYIAERSRP